MNRRKLKLEKYGITPKRYKELSGFCEQYPDWKLWLAAHKDTLEGHEIGSTSYAGGNVSDQTANLAIKREMFQHKVDLIETTAKEAAQDLWPYIIKSVCFEQPFWYIRDIMNAPVSPASFYNKRQYFFYLLDRKKEK